MLKRAFPLFISFFLLCLPGLVGAQQSGEKGQPFISAYTTREINGHVQSWAFAQDDRGVIYVGNGYGILEFDGSSWRMIQTAGQSPGLSLTKGADGRIYVGGSLDIGYLEPDATGAMRYVSLMGAIKTEDRVFSYVRSVLATPEGLYFQTMERIFRFHLAASYASGTKESRSRWEVKTWKPQSGFDYAWRVNGAFCMHNLGGGLMKMTGDSLMLIPGSEAFAGDRVRVLLPVKDKPSQLLVGTSNRGLFLYDGRSFRPFHTKADALLREGTLSGGVAMPDGSFGFSTFSSGFILVDGSGQILQRITQASGLPSNTLMSVFLDRQENIWVACDGGIAIIENKSPLSRIPVTSSGTPSELIRHKGILYTANNNGVNFLLAGASRFEAVSGISGSPQAFGFVSVEDDLLAAVGSGIYSIEGTHASLLIPANTVTFQPISLHRSRLDKNRVFAGLFNGLAVLRRIPGNPRRWMIEENIPGVQQYVYRIAEPEPGTLWLGTYDQGVVRVRFSGNSLKHPAVDRFGPDQGLPEGGAAPSYASGRLFFGATRGIFRFDAVSNRFLPDTLFKGIAMGLNQIESCIVADPEGNLWVNLGRESAFLRKRADGSFRLEKTHLARFADTPASAIYPEKNGVVWFGTANELIRYKTGKEAIRDADYPALIRCVTVRGDSVVFAGSARPSIGEVKSAGAQLSAGLKLPYRLNSLRFEFAAPTYVNPAANQFQSMLAGFDDRWSVWSRENKRDYTNLPEGKYRFLVRAKNAYEQESTEAVYALTILPPWFRTWWTYLGYLLLACGLVLGLVRMRTRQLQERSRALEKTVQERTAEIQDQKNNVEQLSRIGKDITANLSIESIIHTVYENVNTLMDASIFGIGLYNPGKQCLEFPATKEKGKTLPAYSISLADENRLAVWCFKNRRDVVLNDYAREYSKYIRRLQPPVAGEDPESLLYLPLIHKDKTIGVITAQSFSKNAYTEYHLNMLRNLATYSAIALDNADAYRRLNETLGDLKSTQEKLVTQSKLAALGALTAGIAHEIKNPLNFVNNFAELASDLVDDLRGELAKKRDKLKPVETAEIEEILNTLQQNTAKIKEHGRRADSIVCSMLQHSRGKAGERQPSDINSMLEEDINLAYHGMRAQDSTFNIKIEKDFDRSIGDIDVVPQDISRVFLNIISNACYEAHRKKTDQNGDFSPVLRVSSKNLGDRIEVRIRDNGNGIPSGIRDKLFTPFFTTKPTGQGTGLGLSISYDIVVQGHNGQITFETGEGQFTEFRITIPR